MKDVECTSLPSLHLYLSSLSPKFLSIIFYSFSDRIYDLK